MTNEVNENAAAIMLPKQPLKMNLIAALCENMGIGKNNDLPWRLRKEFKYFAGMTTRTSDPSKKNVVVIGRKCWESIPCKPLKDRINIVLSRSLTEKPEGADYLCKSFEELHHVLNSPELLNKVETVWNCGGHDIYKEALESSYAHRLYLTQIMARFDCDVFFPGFDFNNYRLITLPEVPSDVQEEDGIQYKFEVYERVQN